MNFEVCYKTRWLKETKFCGLFETLTLASSYVDYLQNNIPNGKKIRFNIAGNLINKGVTARQLSTESVENTVHKPYD